MQTLFSVDATQTGLSSFRLFCPLSMCLNEIFSFDLAIETDVRTPQKLMLLSIACKHSSNARNRRITLGLYQPSAFTHPRKFRHAFAWFAIFWHQLQNPLRVLLRRFWPWKQNISYAMYSWLGQFICHCLYRYSFHMQASHSVSPQRTELSLKELSSQN